MCGSFTAGEAHAASGGEAKPVSIPRSKTGWIFVVLYGALAAYLIDQALTCAIWMCDLNAFPATIPFGLLYLGLLKLLDPVFFFGSITYAPFTNWFFIVPTAIGNAVIYYWLGVGVAKIWTRLRRRKA
jgi:hypothetical protein